MFKKGYMVYFGYSEDTKQNGVMEHTICQYFFNSKQASVFFESYYKKVEAKRNDEGFNGNLELIFLGYEKDTQIKSSVLASTIGQ